LPEYIVEAIDAAERRIIDSGRAGAFTVEVNYPSRQGLLEGRALVVKIVSPSTSYDIALPLTHKS
jgi:hypothetical protein